MNILLKLATDQCILFFTDTGVTNAACVTTSGATVDDLHAVLDLGSKYSYSATVLTSASIFLLFTDGAETDAQISAMVLTVAANTVSNFSAVPLTTVPSYPNFGTICVAASQSTIVISYDDFEEPKAYAAVVTITDGAGGMTIGSILEINDVFYSGAVMAKINNVTLMLNYIDGATAIAYGDVLSIQDTTVTPWGIYEISTNSGLVLNALLDETRIMLGLQEVSGPLNTRILSII